MKDDISRSLKLLRKERGTSQRQAATRLEVSQALLSHYENGAREPGIDFICRACDFYGVTSDFLLGRTMSRDGSAISPEELYDAGSDRQNRLSGSASAMLSKKLIVNSVSLLFDLLGRIGSRGLIAAAMRSLGASVYRLFRLLYGADGKNPREFFSLPEEAFLSASLAEQCAAEARFSAVLAGKLDEPKPDLPSLSHSDLEKSYPLLAPSLLNVLYQAGEKSQLTINN